MPDSLMSSYLFCMMRAWCARSCSMIWWTSSLTETALRLLQRLRWRHLRRCRRYHGRRRVTQLRWTCPVPTAIQSTKTIKKYNLDVITYDPYIHLVLLRRDLSWSQQISINLIQGPKTHNNIMERIELQEFWQNINLRSEWEEDWQRESYKIGLIQ